MTPEELMQRAIEAARVGIDAGQSPFGCAVWLDGELVACEHNSVVASSDSTAHAEINALRAACRHKTTYLLEGAVVATTCEPCPMCMSALHWARVDTVYFGATIEDAARAGFNELSVPAARLLEIGRSSVRLVDSVLPNDCRELFDRWKARPDRIIY